MFEYVGQMCGHQDWVTALSCPESSDCVKVVSGSRDKTLATWSENDVKTDDSRDPFKVNQRLEGHTNFVEDVAVTTNGDYALSASSDGTARLWDLQSGATSANFQGHEKDVLSVALSYDNRVVVTGSRDNKLKIWNVVGQCKFTTDEDSHTDWVTCVRFCPGNRGGHFVSGSWDQTVKVWNQGECLHTLRGHTGHVTCVAISPDGSLVTSAGHDGVVKLWDLGAGAHLLDLRCDEMISALAFSPRRYWVCAATETSIRVWDMETKTIIAELGPESNDSERPKCVSLTWSPDGVHLFGGYTDGIIRVWVIKTV